ncbi:hypothetical protein APHAL10511_007485 [Amanita phalloides]|nr:hypothetical protein APHAL10511_007485 [Amanita phalloides]
MPDQTSTSRKRDFHEFQAGFKLTDEDDLLGSQVSSASDEQSLDLLLIAQQLAAAKERKREERELKLLKAAERHLEKELAKPVDAFMAMVKNVEQIYADFLMDYATCEDEIRSLWKQLLEEHKKLLVIEKALLQKHQKAAEVHEKQMIDALSKMDGAFQETTEIIDNMLP